MIADESHVTQRVLPMSRAKSPAETLLTEVLAQAVTPSLKAAGFRKTSTSYHRRHGSTVQVVNVQVSHGSNWAEKKFYINVGIAFDAICELAGVPVLEKPKEYECDGRGTRDRIEALVPGAPQSWVVRHGASIDGTMTSLNGFMDHIRSGLDKIDSPAAYRSHPWFDRFRPRRENAQILYLLGDMDGAWHEVQNLVTLLSDRPNAPSEDWFVKKLCLSALAPRLSGQRP